MKVGALLGGFLLLTVTACGSSNAAHDAASQSSDVSGDLVVFAGSSLTESFLSIGERFEAANPGASVTFNFAASSTLAQQITSGAPADVFASASPANMAEVTEAGESDGDPAVFVRNRLQIAVPAGNPGDVTGLAAFADEELIIAICAEEVPCGAAAHLAFKAAGVTPAPDTLEQDVKATLSKVVLGEVDAALVYRTDVIAAGGRVEGIEFPEADEAVNEYPITVLKSAPNPTAARAFVNYVLSGPGQQLLVDTGFAGP